MRSTRNSLAGNTIPIAADDALESLRRIFHTRLQSERVQLTRLATALTQTELTPPGAFEELRVCAHRMRGAAAMFNYLDVAAAAKALEQVAAVAATRNAKNFDPAVWAPLVALLGLLGRVAPASLNPKGDPP
jgi:HPt (histidine-containing phosphotransfer) domain-containing protein